MNEEVLLALMRWIDARIDEKIADALGRDSGREWLLQHEWQKNLSRLTGVSTDDMP